MSQFTANGVIYEELPNGKVRVVGYANQQQSAPQTIQLTPPSPIVTQQKSADAQNAANQAAISGVQAGAAPQVVQGEIGKTQAEIERLALDNEKARRELIAQPPKTAEVRRAQRDLRNDATLLEIERARQLLREPWSAGNLAGREGFQAIPFAGQNSANLSAVLGGLTGGALVDELTRMREASSTGGAVGSVTEREGERLAGSIASLSQTQDADALLDQLNRMEKYYRNYRALANNEDPTIPEVAQRYGIINDAPAPQAPTPAPQTELRADGRAVSDPELAGANARVNQMLRSGASEAEVRSYLNSLRPGLGDNANGIAENVAYIRQNPNFNPTVSVDQVWEPQNGLMQGLGNAALFEVGGFSPGAAAIGAADMASLGYLDELSGLLGGNTESTRTVMEGVSDRNPMSYLTGQVAGGVGTGLGIERALMRGTSLGNLGRARVGDIAMGAGYGSGSAEGDDRGYGAVQGALVGGLGGAAARNLTNVAGKAMTGITDPAQRYLADRGVPLTIGQAFGGGVKNLEDRLTGMPISGPAINELRGSGMQGFNRAAFDEALLPINQRATDIGETGVEQAQNLVGGAYNAALSPVRLTRDPMFDADMAAAASKAGQLTDPFDRQAQYALTQYVDNAFNPEMTGRAAQSSLRALKREGGNLSGVPFGQDAADVMGGGVGAIESLLARQAPAGTMDAYTAANKAYRNEEVLRDAVNRARNTDGVFTPAQLSTSASQNARRFGNSQGTTNQPFFELSRAGQEVLPSKVPDPGTAGQALIPYGLAASGGYLASDEGEGVQGGLGGVGMTIAGLLAGRAALGNAGVRDAVVSSLLSERNPAIREAGQKLLENDRITSALANSLALQYTQ